MLFIDEVHRFSKTQQDALLAAVENRWCASGRHHREPSFRGGAAAVAVADPATAATGTPDAVRTLVQRGPSPILGAGGSATAEQDAVELLAAVGR